MIERNEPMVGGVDHAGFMESTLDDMAALEVEAEAPIDYDDEGNPIYAADLEQPFSEPIGFYDNLCGHCEDEDLTVLGKQAIADFEVDEKARNEWLDEIKDGLKQLGTKLEEVQSPFQGACGATVPLIEEAARQFSARAYSEVFPAAGPVRTTLVGARDEESMAASRRVRDYMNWQLTELMDEYAEDTDEMLYKLALTGNQFRKSYFDPMQERPVSKTLRLEDFVPAADADDLKSARRKTQVLTLTKSELRARQVAGIYRDVELTPSEGRQNELSSTVDEQTGVDRDAARRETEGDTYQVLEMHCRLIVPGFEDLDETGEPTGIEQPFILTVERESGTVLSLVRNWDEDDWLRTERQHFTHFKLMPGPGFYGLGYINLLGNMQKSATTALRALVDAGMFNNLPGGFKARGMRMDATQPIKFGEFRDVEGFGDDVRKAIVPLPYKEPSMVLFQLLQTMVEMGRNLAAVSDTPIPENARDMASGATIALLEASQKLLSSMHKRVLQAMRRELRILRRINAESMPQVYPYFVDGEPREIYAEDFERVDVLPVADPTAASEGQRIMRSQAVMQLAQSAPGVYNVKAVHRYALEAMGVDRPDRLLMAEEKPAPMDPATQLATILQGKPVQAYYTQDHQAHVGFLQAAMQNPAMMALGGNPQMAQQVQGAVMALVAQHTGFLIRQQMEQTLGVTLPPPPEYNSDHPAGEYDPMERQVESQVAQQMALAAQQLAQQAQQMQQMQQNQQAMQDPQVQIAMKQLAIEEQKVQQKREADQARMAEKAADRVMDDANEDADRRLEEKKLRIERELEMLKIEEGRRHGNHSIDGGL